MLEHLLLLKKQISLFEFNFKSFDNLLSRRDLG